MKKIFYTIYTIKLRYLINYKKPSVKVNQEIYRLHMKLNSLEKHLK